jgi:methionine-rich copper-binding protein CopC
MKLGYSIVTFFTFVFLMSCGGGDSGPSPTPVPVIKAPGKSVLVAPANARTCEEGTNITTTQSTVTFSWNSASDAQSYDLKITNLNNQEAVTQTGIATTTATATLTRGIPYAWTITAKNTGTTTTVSDTWKFYLAGNGVTNYAPFPASAVSPLPGVVTTPTNGKVTLTWETSDVEGSALTYTLYFDTIDGKQTPLDANKNLTAKTKEVLVNSNTVYYWRVVTSDGTNTSTSVVYTFKTN